jgi:hypothetical protein
MAATRQTEAAAKRAKTASQSGNSQGGTRYRQENPVAQLADLGPVMHETMQAAAKRAEQRAKEREQKEAMRRDAEERRREEKKEARREKAENEIRMMRLKHELEMEMMEKRAQLERQMREGRFP